MSEQDVIQGDCLEVMKEIPDKSIDMVLCDLPYGTTGSKWDVVIPFEPLWAQYKRIIRENGAIVLTASQPFTSALVMSNPIDFKYAWVWNKKQTGNPFLANKQPLKIHEDILIFNTTRYFPIMRIGKMRKKGGGSKSQIFGNTDSKENDRYFPVSVLDIPNCLLRAKRQHPTEKPVELFEYLIETYSKEGETILDNCAGSGTTGVAARNLKRNFILIEKEPEYVEIINKRLANP